jgi:hypothetical protein
VDLARIPGDPKQGIDIEGEYLPCAVSLLLIKVLKSWEMCEIRGGLNLSYKCIASFEPKERFMNLRTENPKLRKDLLKHEVDTFLQPG